MSSVDLKELQEFWENKYPHVTVTLWEIKPQQKYLGTIRTQNSYQDLSARTIDELISQGEAYLRTVIK